MNMEPLREFVSLETTRRRLDAELKATKQRLDELEETIIPMFIEAGVPAMTVEVEGVKRTLSIYPDVYASPLNDREEVVAHSKNRSLASTSRRTTTRTRSRRWCARSGRNCWRPPAGRSGSLPKAICAPRSRPRSAAR